MEKLRIAKVMARSGVASRRAAEEIIFDGRVHLNGKLVLTPATFVDETDIITVDGKPILKKEITRLWLYHKPAGLITSYKDPSGKPTIFSKLPKSMPRVVSVGRLDINSEGLLLLTNDGKFANFFENPKNAFKRVYRVRIFGNLPDNLFYQLQKGVVIDGINYAPIDVMVESDMFKKNKWLTLTLTEGKNREIRKIFNHFNLSVSRLIRISYGDFTLGNLQQGQTVEVATKYFQDILNEIYPVKDKS